jgi:hypothetical protein
MAAEGVEGVDVFLLLPHCAPLANNSAQMDVVDKKWLRTDFLDKSQLAVD